MSQTKSPPVNEGEEYNLTIESKGIKGDGISKVAGYVIFIPGAKVGRKYKVRIKKSDEKYGFADIVEEMK